MTQFLLLTLLSCGRDQAITDSPSPTGDDTGQASTGCQTDDECAGWEICEAEACVDGDRNNSVDEAEPVLWQDHVSGWINPAGDVDYYVFTAEGGEFVKLSTTTEAEDADTVVVLRKPNGKVVAWADDYPTGTSVTGVDSVVYAWLSEAGDYTVSVEDAGSYYSGGEPTGGSDYTYELSLDEWSQHTGETDTFDDPSVSLDVSQERMWSAVGAVLEEEGDVDYVGITLGVDGATLYLDGNQDMDGSDATARVRLLDDEGQPLTDKIDVGPSNYALYPSAPAGHYVVELSDAHGGGGANHWLFLHVIARVDDPAYTAEVEPDDTVGTPLSLTEYENSSGKQYQMIEVEGVSASGTDVDLFSFEAPYDDAYVVACLNSAEWGAAVAQDLALLDGTGAELASVVGDVDATPDARLENVQVTPGSYTLRVSPPADAEGGADHWYRLRLYVASFSVSSYEEGGYGCP